ncbi:hypothetical protein [Streptomyces misionensis]|uniref:hypothetical protein n=1 Tax=Streptomyces misionensis TaxID=67331 RepID=UPI0036A29659
MEFVRRAVPPVLLSCLLLTGCSSALQPGSATSGKDGTPAAGPSGTTVSPGAVGIAVGSGPQKTYTVQRQPAAGSCRYRYEKGEPLEDTSCTPGAVSPAVTQATLASTICRKSGYTKGIRPPESVTGPEKRANAASYGYTGRLGDAEYDHLISLGLGGNDARNLWVEPPDPGHKTGSAPYSSAGPPAAPSRP